MAQGYYCNILVGLGYFILVGYVCYNKYWKSDQLEDLEEDLADSIVSEQVAGIERKRTVNFIPNDIPRATRHSMGECVNY